MRARTRRHWPMGERSERWSGANTGIHSEGCEILKRENYTKREIFYLNYLFKIRSDCNMLNFFLLILYWCFSEKGEKIGLLSSFYTDVFHNLKGKYWAPFLLRGMPLLPRGSGGCGRPPAAPPVSASGVGPYIPTQLWCVVTLRPFCSVKQVLESFFVNIADCCMLSILNMLAKSGT